MPHPDVLELATAECPWKRLGAKKASLLGYRETQFGWLRAAETVSSVSSVPSSFHFALNGTHKVWRNHS